MRVLYVALTRAKEKLIVVGRQKDANKKMLEKQAILDIYLEDNKKINSYLLEKYKTYLDWLELIYLKEGTENTKDIFSVNINKKEDLIKDFEHEECELENIYEKIEYSTQKYNTPDNNKTCDKIKEFLNWKYGYEGLEGIPTKTSVTKIKEMTRAEEIKENTKNIKINIQENEKKEMQVSITQKPKFLNDSENNKITNAQKGTLMHLCVQKMNEKQEYDLKKINELINELKTKELISQAEAESINANKLLEYTKSHLWEELKTAKEINKEKPFYINVKASRLYDNIRDIEDEDILVQGIIDLYYIDKEDKLVLVDYKTDYIEKGKENELVEKYKEQLKLYKEALESALQRKVDKMEIYSLYLNKEIDLLI